MLNGSYKESFKSLFRFAKSFSSTNFTVPRLALVMAQATAGTKPYPGRHIHIEEISYQVPELPIKIFRVTNDFETYSKQQVIGNFTTVEDRKAVFDHYYDYSKEGFRKIIKPNTINIYVQATVIEEEPYFINAGHIAFFPTDDAGHIIEDGVISFRNLKGVLPNNSRLIYKLEKRKIKVTGVFNGILYPFLKDAVVYSPTGDSELISEFRLFCKKALMLPAKGDEVDLFNILNSSTIIQCSLSDLAESSDVVASTRLKLLREVRKIKESISQYYYLTDGWLITEAAVNKLRKEAPELLDAPDVEIETVISKIKELDPTCEPEKVNASNCVTYVIALRGDRFKIQHLRPEAAAVHMLEHFLEKYFARLLNPGKIVQKLANVLKPVPDDAPIP